MATRLLITGLLASIAFAQPDRSSVCAGCHRQIWESYRKTGMARSFAPASPGNTPLPQRPYYHAPSESYFTLLSRGEGLFQRRYQLDSAGREINSMEKSIDYVMGSGNHARTYLHRTAANTLIELPLGWYAEKGGYWAMNPGYDRPDHEGFRRPVTYDCMFCHNAYPKVPARNQKPGEDSVYVGALPEGLDCERCHGSGARHVELAGKPGSARHLVRQAIVNPARLGAERQMEICMACHLETTSFPLPNAIIRYDRGPFSFRPGEPLANFILNFDHAPDKGRKEKFEIVSSAYRLRQSACYLKSAGKMTCTTCHNAHHAPRGPDAAPHYDTACRQCHPGTLSAASHASPKTSCIECHMPKRRTEDVIHVSVTDHLIQRTKPTGDLLAERTERRDDYRGEVVPYYPRTLPGTLPRTGDSELYLAVAQVKQKSNLKAGIVKLTAAIARYSPQRADWYFELAQALENDGQLAKALPWYREAARRDSSSAMNWQKLGTLLRRLSRNAEAVTVFERSISLSGRALTWHELGMSYRSLGRPANAQAAFEKAITLDAELPEAHNNLGILRFSTGDAARGEGAFREAIRIKPDYADAHANLANLLASTARTAERTGEAEAEFTLSLRLRPNDAGTRYNYAMLLGQGRRYDDAQRELETALRADPAFADAHELLGDLLMARNQAPAATIHYREVLRLRPQSAGASLNLGTALAAGGNSAEAIPLLRRAAAAADAEIRGRARAVLQQVKVTLR